MTEPLPTLKAFSEEDMRAFDPEMKIGVLATVNPRGQPHLTLISTLRAADPKTVVWGQFAEGQSKDNVLQNPKTGFLIMTLDKNTWRGKATFTHTAISGKDYEFYNNTPMFRYNAYFGIHRVYYMDLLEQSDRQPLPMGGIVAASVKTMAARALAPLTSTQPVLNPWTCALIDKVGNLKFACYVDQDGYPVVIPLLQAQTSAKRHVLFSAGAFGDDLKRIPQGAVVAFLTISLSMEDVLLRGRFLGLERRAGLLCGTLETDWVYNPMPPTAGQIYPPLPFETVREF